MYMLMILLNVVTIRIEALVISGYKFLMPVSKSCELSDVLNCEALWELFDHPPYSPDLYTYLPT
jgi:hypothetical protein